jgi:hypothetical protein
MTLAEISPIVSIVALSVSLLTAWFTILRRGSVRSTRPSFIAIRYDFVGKAAPQAKVFLRSMLFTTGKRGHVIESLSLHVREGNRGAEFSFWGHGDKDLIRGSGLFIPESGVVTNHHFNPTDSEKVFVFSAGGYTIELIAHVFGRKRPAVLWQGVLQLSESPFGTTIARDTAVYFSWSPHWQRYVSTIESRAGGLPQDD